MSTMIKAICLLMLTVFCQVTFAQDNKEKALEKGRSAIKLIDEGKVDEGIKLLQEAQQLDPDRGDYSYELAYAYYLKEDYKGAAALLEKTLTYKDVSEKNYQLLGNSYDMLGKSDKAFEVYDVGLKKFPNSGELYLEKGNMYWIKKEYGKALPLYEKGIEVDPQFPSNYYRASRIYCNSSEKVWGLLYGELFLNLEPGSERAQEISKLLYDTYKGSITVGDSTKIDFCNIVMDAKDLADKDHIKMPFCMVYGQAFIMSIIFVKTIDLNSLDKIRTTFLENYYKQGHNKTHPNILFDFQQRLVKEGHFEAYNHWLLSMGEREGFSKWKAANAEKWTNFIAWFKNNRLTIDSNNKFYSGQY